MAPNRFFFRDAVWHAAYAMHSKSSIGIGHRYVSSQPTFAIKFTKLKDSANVCRFALAKLHTVQCTSTTSTCFTLIFSFYSPFLCVSFHNQHIKSLEKKKKPNQKHFALCWVRCGCSVIDKMNASLIYLRLTFRCEGYRLPATKWHGKNEVRISFTHFYLFVECRDEKFDWKILMWRESL